MALSPGPAALPPPQIPALPWHVLRGKVVKLLAIFGIILLDPFGFQASLVSASRRFEDRLGAMIYQPRYQENIVVVALADSRADWPPNWSRWSALLERLEELGAGAVFLDVELTTPRGDAEGIANLEAFLRNRRGPGSMPVVLADHGRFQVTREARADCAPWGELPGGGPDRRARSGLAADLACDTNALAFYDWPLEKDHRAYPLHALHAPHPGDGQAARPVLGPLPATVMAALACQVNVPRRPAWCDTAGVGWLHAPPQALEAASRGDAPAAMKALPRSLRPLWAIGAVDTRIGAGDNCHDYGAPGDWERLTLMGRLLGQELVGRVLPVPLIDLEGATAEVGDNDAPAILRRPCFVPRVVSGARDSLLSSPGRPQDEAALRDQLRGRLVLIGDARIGSPDIVVSPLHGTSPGVILHATALLNLLDRGPAYQSVDSKCWTMECGKVRDWGIKAILAAVSFGLLCIVVRVMRRAEPPASPWWRWWHGAARHPAMVALGRGAADHDPFRARTDGIVLRIAIALLLLTILAGTLLAFLLGWHMGAGLGTILLAGAVLWLFRLLSRAGGSSSDASTDPGRAEAARTERGVHGIVTVFRLVVFGLAIALLIGTAATGNPSASPLLVLLVALAIVFPILEHGPLDDATH